MKRALILAAAAVLAASVCSGSLAAVPAKQKAKSPAKSVSGKAGDAKPAAKSTAKPPAAKDAKSKKASDPKAKQAPQALPKVLDLGGRECIPCKMMAIVLDELNKEYKGQLKTEFIDIWKNPAAAKKYKAKTVPTQILFDARGKEIYRHEGYFPKDDILKTFKSHGITFQKAEQKK